MRTTRQSVPVHRLATVFVAMLLFLVSAGVRAPEARALITLDQFVSSTTGQSLANAQGEYRGECVSLVAQYLGQVHGITVDHWGNAVDYRAGGTGGNQLAARGFTWSTDTNFRDGDIVVWGSGAWTTSYGHIAVWYHGQIYDQNFNGRRTGGSHAFFGYGYLGHWRKTPPISNQLPQASLDDVNGGPGQIRVRGWAFDRDNLAAQLGVHVYMGGPAGSGAPGYAIAANTSRPDVENVFGPVGQYHGFDSWISTNMRGTFAVYVYAINVPQGDNPLIGQRTVTVSDPNPFGRVDSATSPSPGYLRVRGWAADPNSTTASIGVHLYVGAPAGTAGADVKAVTANLSRSDIAATYPEYGDKHGFDLTFYTGRRGAVPVYGYALNTGPGDNQAIGSGTATVAAPKYVSLAPSRVLDTRYGIGAPKAVVPAGGRVDLQVTGVGGVPAGASAVVLNVTAVSPTGPGSGYVTVWPTGAVRPTASNLNFVPGQTVPNLVVTKVGTGGKVSLYTAARTQLIADVAGYYPAGAAYTGVTPVRVLDTRYGIGAPKVRIPAGGTVTVTIGGANGVPANASAAVVNITTVGPAGAGSVTAYPAGVAVPSALSVSYRSNQTIAGMGVVKLGTGGKITLRSTASTELIVDLDGWVPAVGDTVAFTPTRLVTNRAVASGGSFTVQVAGVAGVPANAKAVQVTVTAANPSTAGYLTVYPTGGARPVVSNLNYTTGGSISNSAIVKVGTGGTITVFASGATPVTVDTSAYWTP
ncbi:hypothetical protein DFJ65_3168 [Calidifontibacter indicus]|uniref:CHAP domain-containing protein n=2 Tax=Calidifontibacter indicus TaxID=419650 RepID=A0A3D9UU55_9MICO|nr:hypothetical protein DFJ65_3168 [Calidifontibacter indicus]